jgi:hypothetical protein
VASHYHVYSHNANPAIDLPDEYVDHDRKALLVSTGICQVIGPRKLQRVRTSKFDNRCEKAITTKKPVDYAQVESGASGWKIVNQTRMPYSRGRVQIGPACPKCSTVR